MRALERCLVPCSTIFLLVVAGFALAPQPALAQEAEADLGARVEALYAVEAVPGGVVLAPRRPLDGVETITLSGDEIRINGARVPRAVVRSWLEEKADLVLELGALSPRDRRLLFGLSTDDLEVEAPAEAAVAEAPEPPEPPEGGRDGEEGEEGDRVTVEVDIPGVPPVRLEGLPGHPRPPHPPAPYRTGSQFNLFGDLIINEGESARDAVAIFGSVTVEGEVRGDVTAVAGSVRVNGRVDGEVTAVNGSVFLGPSSEVLRGVTAVGGEVERAPGARVRGSISEVPVSGLPFYERGWDDGWSWRWQSGRVSPWRSFWTLFWSLIGLLTCGLFLCAALLIAPRAVDGVAKRAAVEWWWAGLAGFLSPLAFGLGLALVCVVLAITIIGIPFLILLLLLLALLSPFLVIALILCMIAGYAGVCLAVGRWLAGRIGLAWTSNYAHLLLGFGTLHLLSFVGELTSSVGGPARAVGWPMEAVGALIILIAGCVGFGAVLLGFFRRYGGGRFSVPPAPAAGPAPAGPGTLPPLPPPAAAADGDAEEAHTVVTEAPPEPPTEEPAPEAGEGGRKKKGKT